MKTSFNISLVEVERCIVSKNNICNYIFKNIKWLNNIFVKNYMLSWYTTKCKNTLKMIQIIEKLNEVLSHILNMNWLYHFNYNWKVWLMRFHKKHLDKLIIQTNISVVKKNIFFWKINFILKMTIIMLEEFVSKSISYVYQNIGWMFFKKLPQKLPPHPM
jgi:hypothetical protein